MIDYEGLMAETVLFRGHQGDEISGYLSRPLGPGPYPSVVVVHSIFGLHLHFKELALKFAIRGFAALALDLYHREGPGEPDDVAEIVKSQGGNPDDRMIGDVAGAAETLRSIASSNGKIGVIGYCSGGRQTYLAACKIPSLAAAVDCYGGGVVAGPAELSERQPVAPIELTESLNCPLLGLFGGEDTRPSPEDTQMTEQELQRLGKTYEFHTYEDAGHAFFSDNRPSYRQHAAVDGWEKVFAWFGRYLS